MAFRPLIPTAPTTTSGFRPLTPAAPTPAPTQPPKTGLFSRIKTGVVDAYKERGQNVQQAAQRERSGQTTKAETLLKSGSQAALLAGDTAFTAAKETVRSVAPSVIPAVKKTLGAVLQTKPAQAVAQKYGQVKEAHPRAVGIAEDVAGIASVFPTVKGTQIAGKAGAKSVKVATEAADTAVRATGKAASKAPASMASVLTNVPRDVFERAADPEWTPLIEKAIKHVSENEKQPYFDIAARASQAINGAERRAADRLAIEKNLFKGDNRDVRFDVASRYEDIAVALKPFRSSGLIVDTKDGPRGKVLDFKVGSTPQSSFTDREVNELNALLSKIKASNEVEIDDLLSLRQAFSTAYDAIPLGVNQNPRPYHAAVMSLKQSAERTIDEILPPGLKEAFAQYRALEEMKEAIGNKVIDGQGNLKDTAEQFLANLANVNKGNLRSSADELKAMTGIDIVKEVQAIKDAQKLSENFPRTGSRSQDILRSLLAAGIGGTSGMGLPGAAAGLAATSPKVMGKAALVVGKVRANKQAKKVGQYLKEVQPGLSTKNVADTARSVTPESVARHIDQTDLAIISEFLAKRNAGNPKIFIGIREKAMPMLRSMGIDKLPDADQARFLQEVKDHAPKKLIDALKSDMSEAGDYVRDTAGRFAKKTLHTALQR